MRRRPGESGIPPSCGSHAPVLKAIARFTKIRSVIEFGGGEHSTSLFLDHGFYPDLTSLVTFENNHDWAKTLLREDPRYSLVITGPQNFAGVSKGMNVDLVFLDSGPVMQDRWNLLKHAILLAPILAIHDSKPTDIEGFITPKFVKGFNSGIQTVVASDTIELSDLSL